VRYIGDFIFNRDLKDNIQEFLEDIDKAGYIAGETTECNCYAIYKEEPIEPEGD
jgi:hypothetical protein